VVRAKLVFFFRFGAMQRTASDKGLEPQSQLLWARLPDLYPFALDFAVGALPRNWLLLTVTASPAAPPLYPGESPPKSAFCCEAWLYVFFCNGTGLYA
jgi:hypothetical protein